MLFKLKICYNDETNKKMKDEVNVQNIEKEKSKYINIRNIIKANSTVQDGPSPQIFQNHT